MTTDFTVLHEGSWPFPSRVDSEKEARCRVRYGIPILCQELRGCDSQDRSFTVIYSQRGAASSQSSSPNRQDRANEVVLSIKTIDTRKYAPKKITL